ncbi:MAG: nucleotidyltransferase domain-containing protein [Promethearchaeia archaeon]
MGRDEISQSEKVFRELLSSQEISSKHRNYIESKRKEVENRIRDKIDGPLEFYYGGSYSRETMIRDYSDINLVVYYPKETEKSITDIHSEVGDVITSKWRNATLKTLGWEIRYKTNLHIDVIPAKPIDLEFGFAKHYNTNRREPIEYSLKAFDEDIKEKKRTNILKLMRLWKTRCEVPLQGFFLEKFVTLATRGAPRNELETQVFRSFSYLEDKITTKRIIGVMNKSYVLSNAIRAKQIKGVKNAIEEVRNAKDWEDAFNN